MAKRKILGLTMKVTREFYFTKYEFINPCTLQVVNAIIDELSTQFPIVKNCTIEHIINGKEVYTGYIHCKTEQQAIKWYNSPINTPLVTEIC